MNRVFTLIEMLIALVILFFMFSLLDGQIAVDDTNCAYEYTDLDGNVGKFYFCTTHIGGGMTCTSGDYKYTIQVKEYHRVCEEVNNVKKV